jgi:hypothetical protein
MAPILDSRACHVAPKGAASRQHWLNLPTCGTYSLRNYFGLSCENLATAADEAQSVPRRHLGDQLTGTIKRVPPAQRSSCSMDALLKSKGLLASRWFVDVSSAMLWQQEEPGAITVSKLSRAASRRSSFKRRDEPSDVTPYLDLFELQGVDFRGHLADRWQVISDHARSSVVVVDGELRQQNV